MSEEVIKDPLWSMMLSTNDCFPGCSCDDDYFDICSERISKWLADHNIDKLIEAKKQLLSLKLEDREKISNQTNVFIYSDQYFQEWINEWLEEIDEALA